MEKQPYPEWDDFLEQQADQEAQHFVDGMQERGLRLNK
jgi:hypothetical protein